MARYQQGELHRLRGEFALAHEAYRDAAAHGHDPGPGLALLRLAEGDVAAATALIRRVLAEHRGAAHEPIVLGAAVEVLVAADDLDAAAAACTDLKRHAEGAGTPLLSALADHARGTVVLAEGDAGEALSHLRRACRAFHEIDLPYEAARSEVRIAEACLALGDPESARLSLDAARATFARLGAAPDLEAVDRLGTERADRAGPLTAREQRGAAPGRGRQDQPGDRRGPHDQPAHRGPAPPEHLHEAGPVVSVGGDGLRLRARPHLTGRCTDAPCPRGANAPRPAA